MAYTQGDLDNLQRSIAKGVTELTMGGEKVRFHSLDEMLRLEKKLKSELGIVPNTRRVNYPRTSGGFR